MFKRARYLLVLLAALAMALVASIPATADDGTSTPTPTEVAGTVEDFLGTTGEGTAETDASSSQEESAAGSSSGTDTGATSSSSDSAGPEPTKSSDSEDVQQPGPAPQGRVQPPGDAGDPGDTGAAALADPVTAALALPPGFGLEELEELVGPEGLDLGLDEEQLAALLAALQGLGEEEDPLAEFCDNFDVPVLCGEADPENPPAFSCEQFAILFGFENCEDIPLCIPAPPPPPGLPLPPPPSPPFCETPATPTTPPGNSGGGSSKPPTYQPGQTQAGYQYRNCDEARAAGAAPIYAGQYGYGTHLDSDYDGIGCEEQLGTYTPTTQAVAYDTGGGKLAYTGVATEPLIAWGAALVGAGGWLLLSGRRKA